MHIQPDGRIYFKIFEGFIFILLIIIKINIMIMNTIIRIYNVMFKFVFSIKLVDQNKKILVVYTLCNTHFCLPFFHLFNIYYKLMDRN